MRTLQKISITPPPFPAMTNNRWLDSIQQLHKTAVFDNLQPWAKVLDIGSGEGVLIQALKEQWYVVEGIDKEYHGQRYVLDLDNIPLLQEFVRRKWAYYDLVISSCTAQYLKHPFEVIRLANMLLKEWWELSFHLGFVEVFAWNRPVTHILQQYDIPFREEQWIPRALDSVWNIITHTQYITAVFVQHTKRHRPYTIPLYKDIGTLACLQSASETVFPLHCDKWKVYALQESEN